MLSLFKKKHTLKIVINDINFTKPNKEVLQTDARLLQPEGDFFHLKLENPLSFKAGHLKAFSFPDNFKPDDFINYYHIDADLAEVFKTAATSEELSTILTNYKLIYLSQVFVEHKYRRTGLGTKLVKDFHELVQELYPDKELAIVLTASPLGKDAANELDIHESTARLTSFYRNLGYSDLRGSIVKYIKLQKRRD